VTVPTNPYPGARPLRWDEEHLLLGRAQKIADLVDAIRAMPVVELTAPSGLGKSSLLDAGVLPTLESAGFEVAPLRSWAELEPPGRDADADPAGAGRYYCDAVAAAVRNSRSADHRGLAGSKLLEYLADTYGSRLVLIFDQFEELLRDDPTLGRRVLDEIVTVARTLPFHQVISMRSEFKEELGKLEGRLRYNQWVWIRLDELEPKVADAIVVAPVEQLPEPERFSWEEPAVELVRDWWARARKQDWKVGLLHLQALLWSVVQELAPEPGSKVTAAAIEALVGRWLADRGHRPDTGDLEPVALFETALAVYVDLRLGTPSKTPDADIRQALYAASRYSAELSSAGYKLVRDSLELSRFAFPGVKGELSFSNAFVEEAVRTAETLLLRAADPIAALQEMPTTLPAKLRAAHADREALQAGDPSGTAGAMVRATPLDTACAEIAAYQRSLLLLEERSILRVTPTLGGGRRVALIHDGFGDAIEAWGRKVGADPLAAIESTTALSAKQLMRGLGKDGLSTSRLAVTGADAVENVRWIGCNITTTLHDIEFRNCRFSSTLFYGCVFRNVRFDNCEFRGALFLDCQFEGERGTVIEVTDAGSRDDCRVSATTVKRCSMTDGGLTFAGMTGSGLLFEECEGGPWSLRGCDLSHVALDGARHAAQPLWGSIDGCNPIVHLSITGRAAEETLVKDSDLRLVTIPPKHRLLSVGTTTVVPPPMER
jgi:hypothetical protein